jgi:hypothetical protein
MKSRFLLVVTAILIVGVGYIGYAKRYQVAAKLWHWRHGNSAIVSGYQIPVPEGWLVTSQTDEHLELVVTDIDGRGSIFANIAVGTGRPKANQPRDLTLWRSNKQQFLESKGLKDIDERSLHFDDETVVCMGGLEARDIWRFPNATLFTLECMSTGPLNFMYVGQKSEVPQFEAVVSGIRKH